MHKVTNSYAIVENAALLERGLFSNKWCLRSIASLRFITVVHESDSCREREYRFLARPAAIRVVMRWQEPMLMRRNTKDWEHLLHITITHVSIAVGTGWSSLLNPSKDPTTMIYSDAYLTICSRFFRTDVVKTNEACPRSRFLETYSRRTSGSSTSLPFVQTAEVAK